MVERNRVDERCGVDERNRLDERCGVDERC